MMSSLVKTGPETTQHSRRDTTSATQLYKDFVNRTAIATLLGTKSSFEHRFWPVRNLTSRKIVGNVGICKANVFQRVSFCLIRQLDNGISKCTYREILLYLLSTSVVAVKTARFVVRVYFVNF